ncbi:MAG: hypothetical protein AAFQ75_06145, partial [Pseudomonadota bacterium]
MTMPRLAHAFTVPLALALSLGCAGAHVIEAPSTPAKLGEPGVNALEGAKKGGGVKLIPSGEFPL